MAPETELVVYRVTQEALTNVARHARARSVELGVARRGDVLVLRVADDGVGGANAAIGAGIQGMHERAHVVGGRLEVRTREGAGTEVVLEVPIAGRADMMVRILLADDHSMVRAGVPHILNAEPNLTVVAEAADCAEAVELARPPRTWPCSTSRCRG